MVALFLLCLFKITMATFAEWLLSSWPSSQSCAVGIVRPILQRRKLNSERSRLHQQQRYDLNLELFSFKSLCSTQTVLCGLCEYKYNGEASLNHNNLKLSTLTISHLGYLTYGPQVKGSMHFLKITDRITEEIKLK